ncbi:MAG: sigma-70 family RNA polymerase sigma factor [Chloroflexota bacterium]|nr:sigma-70 family RNA polymerase sigma factor [Chloroflexota bacterium]
MIDPSSEPHVLTPGAAVALVQRARDGDLGAFNELVELHQRTVYNLCLRMLGSGMPAEDATQDVFVSAFKNIRQFKGASFRAWLMRIAANACTDELRRRRRRPALSLDTPPPGSEDPLDPADAAPGPETLTLRAEQREWVQAALLRLPADQRMAVILCDIQGFAYEEIAASMRTSVGTVKSRIARGRDKLRRDLGSAPSEQSGIEDRR